MSDQELAVKTGHLKLNKYIGKMKPLEDLILICDKIGVSINFAIDFNAQLTDYFPSIELLDRLPAEIINSIEVVLK